jgi:hypothetical protein
MPAFLEKLRQEAGVEILDEKFKPKETPKPAAGEPAKDEKKAAATAPDKK